MNNAPVASATLPWWRHGIVFAFVGGLCVLGVRGLLIDDSRFTWGMFSKQLRCEIVYILVDEAGEETAYSPRHLQGVLMQNALAPGAPRMARYGVHPLEVMVRGYLRFLARQDLPEGTTAVRARLVYTVNTETEEHTLTLTEPVPGGAAS